MAKISDFELCKQHWSYYAITYRDIPVGYVECTDGDWTATSLWGYGWRTKALSELFDKYINSVGKPSLTALFKTAVLSSRSLKPCATRTPRRIL